MKHIAIHIIIFALVAFNFLSISYAASPTPADREPSSTPSGALTDRIQKIKDMVASRVAELKLVEKRGLLGKVLEFSNTQITIEDEANVKKFIDIDELTKFEDSSNKTFGISDIKKGDMLSAVGLYNKDSKRLLSRVISTVKNLPAQFEGIVTSLNTRGFELDLITADGTNKTIAVETSTKTFAYSEDGKTVKSGFSKIAEGQRILVTGFESKTDGDTVAAIRVLHFLDLPPSAEMKNHQVTAEKISQPPNTTSKLFSPTPTKTTLR